MYKYHTDEKAFATVGDLTLFPAFASAQTNYVITNSIVSSPSFDSTLTGPRTGKANTSGASNLFIGRSTGTKNMASAEEVVKEEVDVSKMQAKLLKKVEELTLYVIELKKQNDALKQKSAVLERLINKL